MKKKKFGIAFVLFLVAGIVVFATPGKSVCTYALPNSNYTIRFSTSPAIFDLTAGGSTYKSAGSFKVSGSRLIVTFKNDSKLGSLSGVTFVLTILSNGDLDGGDGIWVEI
jgi:hypothetical protein